MLIMQIFGALITLIVQLSDGAVVCPSNPSYSPCNCTEYGAIVGNIYLDCRNQQLSDSKAEDILTSFLTSPGVSQVASIDLHFSQLTRIPDQIRSFSKLVYLDISFNSISSLQSNAFNFVSKVTTLYANTNQIKSIAPGAFGGTISSSRIDCL